jgi:hypothetical protein
MSKINRKFLFIALMALLALVSQIHSGSASASQPCFISKYEKMMTISDSLADHIVEDHRGESCLLWLSSLRELSPETARILSRFNGSIYLDSLEHLDYDAASELRDFKGWLSFGGLTELDDSLLAILSTYQAECLVLDGIRHLPDWKAEILGRYRGALMLGQLQEFSERKAIALARRSLWLDGLKSIAPVEIRLLRLMRRYPGRTFALSLAGLDSLTNEQTDALMFLSCYDDRYRPVPGWHSLVLRGISEISIQQASRLAEFGGRIELGLDYWSGRQFNAISQRYWIDRWQEAKDSLKIEFGDYTDCDSCRFAETLESLTEPQARLIVNSCILARAAEDPYYGSSDRRYGLKLSRLAILSVGVAEQLSQWRGNHITLGNLQKIETGSLRALSKFDPGFLHLRGFTTISDSLLRELAGFRAILLFESLSTIKGWTTNTVMSLSASIMSLGQVQSISDDDARVLSAYRGNLLLPNLDTLTAKQARFLSNLNGYVYMPSLKTVSEETVEAIAEQRYFFETFDVRDLNEDILGNLIRRWKEIHGTDLDDLPTKWHWPYVRTR